MVVNGGGLVACSGVPLSSIYFAKQKAPSVLSVCLVLFLPLAVISNPNRNFWEKVKCIVKPTRLIENISCQFQLEQTTGKLALCLDLSCDML